MIVKGHRVYRGHRSAGHSGLPVLLTILVLILLALLLTFSLLPEYVVYHRDGVEMVVPMLQESGQEPDRKEIARICDLSEEKVAKILALTPDICSLELPVGQDDSTLGDLLEDLDAPEPQEMLVRRELETMLHQMLGNLNPRQQQSLKLHYGLDNGVCYSLEEIGRQLGISKERARQIEHQAMEKLKTMGTSMGLEDFLE